MKPLQLSHLALLLGLSAAPLAADDPEPYLLDMTTVVLNHPTSVTGNAKAVALGRFSVDAIPDAAVLHGSSLHFLYAPDRRNAWSAVSGSYTSIATLPQINALQRDGVIASTSAGLAILTFDESPSVRTLVPSAVSSSSAWANATDLSVVDALDGTWSVFALSAGGDEILSGVWTPGTSAFSTGLEIGLESAAEALAVFQCDDDAPFEFAVADEAGMTFHDDNGESLKYFEGAGAEPMLVAIRDTETTDCVAWMFSPTPTVEQLEVAHTDLSLETTQYFWNVDVRQLTLVDLGGDERKELWLTSAVVPWGIGLRRDTEIGTFLPWPEEEAYLYDLNVEHSWKKSYVPASGSGVYGGAGDPPVAAVMDLDGDGDDDLFLAGHPGQANRSLVCFGEVYNEELGLLEANRVKPFVCDYTFQVSGTFGGVQSGLIDLERPDRPTSGPAATATHTRFAVWTEPSGGGPVTFVTSFETAYAGIPPAPVVNLYNLETLGQNAKIHIETCFIRRNSALDMVWAGPALHQKITVDLTNQGLIHFLDAACFTGGTGESGSTVRPPISPPSGGTTP